MSNRAPYSCNNNNHLPPSLLWANRFYRLGGKKSFACVESLGSVNVQACLCASICVTRHTHTRSSSLSSSSWLSSSTAPPCVPVCAQFALSHSLTLIHAYAHFPPIFFRMGANCSVRDCVCVCADDHGFGCQLICSLRYDLVAAFILNGLVQPLHPVATTHHGLYHQGRREGRRFKGMSSEEVAKRRFYGETHPAQPIPTCTNLLQRL